MNSLSKFTEDERHTISHALFVARERFLENAKELRGTQDRLARQFERQAEDAERVKAIVDDTDEMLFSRGEI